jgi:hypothetical protein
MLLANAVPDSGPGVPLAALGNTNEDVISVFSDVLKEAITLRLTKLSQYDYDEPSSAAHFVCCGLVDPVRVFVKQEPHKVAKIDNNRFRLISSVSTLDSLIERVLEQASCKSEIANWETIPSKSGLGATDDKLDSIGHQIAHLLKLRSGLVDSDVSGWDWQKKWWIALIAAYSVVIELDVVNTCYSNALMARELLASKPLFCFSNGSLVDPQVFGITLSGRYVTSKGNSRGRTALSVIANVPNMAMGDDSQEGCESTAPIQEVFDNLGWRGLVDYRLTKTVEDSVFCSNRFYKKDAKYVAEPVNWRRMLFRLITKKHPAPAEVAQFVYEVRHLRDSDLSERVIAWYKTLIADSEAGGASEKTSQ